MTSEAFAPGWALWVRSDPNRTSVVRPYAEMVQETELAALRSKHAGLRMRMEAAVAAEKARGPDGRVALVQGTMSRLVRAAARDVKRRQRRMRKEKGQLEEKAAIEFLGLRAADVAAMKAAYRDMDAKGRGHLRTADFFKAIG